MFGFIVTLFDLFLYFPLFNALVLIYNYIPGHDFGAAIIILTIVIRFILYPVSVKAFQSQKAMQYLQPKLQELQVKYKQDKERLAKETLQLYKTEKINPFSGLLLAFVQLPILIALYSVFWNGLKPEALKHLYGFVTIPAYINPMFIGLVDLSKPNIVFAILAGITQYFQTKMMMPPPSKSDKGSMASMMQKQMLYMFPVVTVIILFNLPSALGLYWTASGIFSIIQQYFIVKKSGDTKVEKI